VIYKVDNDVFAAFPAFRRGVVVASGVENSGSNSDTAQLLTSAASEASHALTASEKLRISVWDDAYLAFGADPNKFTPSIRFLREQLARQKPPRPINRLVDLFNVSSLRWTAPCGGDDLDSLGGGDLHLGFACGDETFAPLFKPATIEYAVAGEVIYYTTPTRRVLCRRWTWRNSDFSKIRPETRRVAINVDMMVPPFAESDLSTALEVLAQQVQEFCGGTTSLHFLNPTNPEFRIDMGELRPLLDD